LARVPTTDEGTRVVTRTEVEGIQAVPTITPVGYLATAPGVNPSLDGQLHDAYSVTDFIAHVDEQQHR
jgi:hypothetical protein